jgi:hypothetical protein
MSPPTYSGDDAIDQNVITLCRSTSEIPSWMPLPVLLLIGIESRSGRYCGPKTPCQFGRSAHRAFTELSHVDTVSQ